MLLVRSEDDYKNKSYIESALHFSYPIHTGCKTRMWRYAVR